MPTHFSCRKPQSAAHKVSGEFESKHSFNADYERQQQWEKEEKMNDEYLGENLGLAMTNNSGMMNVVNSSCTAWLWVKADLASFFTSGPRNMPTLG